MLIPAQLGQIPYPVADLVPQRLAFPQELLPIGREVIGLLSLGKQVHKHGVGLFRIGITGAVTAIVADVHSLIALGRRGGRLGAQVI